MSSLCFLKANRLEQTEMPTDFCSDVHSWMFRPAGADKDIVIYSSRVGANNKCMTSFSFQTLLDSSVNLVINSTRLINAGLYTCMICVKVSEEGAIGLYTAMIKQTAQLIVLG